MKTTDVGCAIIFKEDKILIAQRNPGSFLAGYWEFPGGKREPNESLEACLVRELDEELGVLIRPARFFCKREHIYPHKKVILYFYLCEFVLGRPVRKECFDFRWVRAKELVRFAFPPPDYDVIEEFSRTFRRKSDLY